MAMPKYRELYRVEGLPVLQNRVFENQEEAINSPQGDMVLVEDLETGLIFNRAFIPGLLTYDSNYHNEQAGSPTFRTHLEQVAEIMEDHFKGKSLFEIGCGKAYFLEYLSRQGYDIKGIDPAYEGTDPRIIKDSFGRNIKISADGIILRHVLEHIPKPLRFFNDIKAATKGKGLVYIEVPCLDWICEHRAWFDIYYEHVNYFRLSDFERIFGVIYKSGRLFGGQYLYVIADLSSLREPIRDDSEVINFPRDFASSIEIFADTITKRQDEGRKAFIWGGASKGVIFSLFLRRHNIHLEGVIDINPAKQGKFLPLTGLKVFSPDILSNYEGHAIDIYVMNGNYLREIKDITGNRFNYMLVDHE